MGEGVLYFDSALCVVRKGMVVVVARVDCEAKMVGCE
jgi:hypothetical protein